MGDQLTELVPKLLNGDRRALARVLSHIENDTALAERSVDLLYPHTGNAYTIGITGSPGAGKSTLVDWLARSLSAAGKKVSILAIDPSSPYSGGALLGDRIRMADSAANAETFIRSMASRGAHGGLSHRTIEAIFALDAAGFDYIILETVGVGQAEVEVVKASDSVIVVVVPGMGDGVQALKAGILEIADIFVINKADYDGADRLERDLLTMLNLGQKLVWKPPLVKAVAVRGEGTKEILTAIDNHRMWAKESGNAERRRTQFLDDVLKSRLSEQLFSEISAYAEQKNFFVTARQELLQRKKSPSALARRLIEDFRQETKSG